MTESGSWHLVRQGAEQPFVVSGDVIVGRSKQADLRIQEGYVSRRHARLWLESGRLMVEDLGSANGTYLNGEKLATRKCLLPGDRVCFDETEFYVEMPARSDSDPNATAHRPPDDEDPDFQRPDRPEDWDPGATAPADTLRPVPSAPPPEPFTPPPRTIGPRPPTEVDFDLDDTDFDLTGPAKPSAPAPAPTPASSAPASAQAQRADTDVEFDLGLTGDTEFDLSIGDARPADAPPPTAIMGPDDIPLVPGATGTEVMAPEEVPRPRPPDEPVGGGDSAGLLFLSGPEEGALYQLAEGRVSLGRAPECDIHIDEASVSKRHAELLIQPGNCRIHDTSNSNGVYVNGDSVDDVVLNPGDVIRLGRIEIMFDSYHKLAEGGSSEEGVPWVLLVGSFLGTVALAGIAYLVLQML